MKTGLNGNEAMAFAAKDAKVDVVAAYPITPQTVIVEKFAEFVANGETDTEFVCVESEHSAMSACVAASIAGGRVFTATSSQGLALMHEILYIAASGRCPIVMGVSNRALSGPINIHCDHSDVMGSRDSGWIQIFVENPQEAYDTVLYAFKLAEHKDIQLPVAVNMDGFITSHCIEGVERLDEDKAAKFLGERVAEHKIDIDNPKSFGPLCLQDYYFEFKKQQDDVMTKVPKILAQVEKGFAELSGRRYSAIETFGLKGAKTAIICMSSTAGTARAAAREMQAKGKKVGVIKIRLYRPFPVDEVRKAVEKLKSVVVLDRAASFGAPNAPLASDIKAALYDAKKKPAIISKVFGLGGRDLPVDEIKALFEEGLKLKSKPASEFIGVRE